MKGKRLVYLLVGLGALAALFFIPGGAKEQFLVAEEFNLQPIIKLPSIGPVDLSVNKAVIYLWLATAIIVVVAASSPAASRSPPVASSTPSRPCTSSLATASSAP